MTRCLALKLSTKRSFSCFIPSSLRKSLIQTNSFLASIASIYSAFVVDKATISCYLDCHDTTPPAKVITYPDVDRLESTSPNISESVKPSSIGFPEPYLRHTLKVPFRYLNIHFTTAQCSFPRLLLSRLKFQQKMQCPA